MTRSPGSKSLSCERAFYYNRDGRKWNQRITDDCLPVVHTSTVVASVDTARVDAARVVAAWVVAAWVVAARVAAVWVAAAGIILYTIDFQYINHIAFWLLENTTTLLARFCWHQTNDRFK